MQLLQHAAAIAVVCDTCYFITSTVQGSSLVETVHAYLAIAASTDPLPEGRADAPNADRCAA